MREQIRQHIIEALNKHTEYFHSEAEIQLFLGDYLRSTKHFDNVFLEYFVKKDLISNYPWKKGGKIYIDIVLEKDNKFWPIEIKYKTKKQKLPYKMFGSEIDIELFHHGAYDEGGYDFWKDVKRIELLNSAFERVEKGFALFITNDETYHKRPKEKAAYVNFSIHEDRSVNPGLLDWLNVSDKEWRKKYVGFEINSEYQINWTKMTIEDHHYILL